MSVSEEEYRLKFFLENGFKRRKCRVCGSYFWTLDPSRDVCGDAPCQDYTFIGRGIKPEADVSYARRLFLDFFRSKGHEVLSPYPVVARWRDDIYLTIASIAVFQPFVTEGVVPPPANPLVISQPCIRLVDIDNVGLTAGRHLTIFEMGGHHAFNYPDREVYWKEETVRLCHEFLTEVVGVEDEEITYKEDFWVGGGNAGPDVEVCVGGLELATLVFMCFKVVGEQYVKMPMRIVDTGYGIERFAWFMSGKPTAFHAIYGDLIDKICREAGVVEPDRELLVKVAKASALMRVERGRTVDELRRELSEVTGVPLKVIEGEIVPMERVFALADHAKCIAFMLADGVVPSNVGEGYLARLVIRRALRLCGALNLEGYLPKLVDEQLRIWGFDYPKLLKARSTILEIVELEEEKFKGTLGRGRGLVAKVVKGLKEPKMPVEALLQLYDSHGLPPEVVRDEAKKLGVEVEVPDNFYGLVAKLHQSASREAEEELKVDVSGLPPTKALYYDDPYRFTFEAKVLRSGEGFVVLDQTCFYPRGGGQEPDRGFLLFNGSRVEVVDVVKVGDVVIHMVNGSVPEGANVKGEVDVERRLELMRHHSAIHVLLEAVRRLVGSHAWQAGAQKWPDRAHIDITHYKQLSEEEVTRIEDLSNQVVLKNLPVRAFFLEREKAEKAYGFEIYQGGVVPGRMVRVVEIEGWNTQACGGTHVTSTGEIGLIKIVKVDRIQDGILRFEIKAGRAALQYAREVEGKLREAAKTLRCSLEALPEAVSKVKAEAKALRKEIERLKAKMLEAMVPTILNEMNRRTPPIACLEVEDMGFEDMVQLADKAVKARSDGVVVLYSKSGDRYLLVVRSGGKAIERGLEAKRIAERLVEKAGGRAGGRGELAQGYVIDVEGLKRALEELK